MSPRIETLHNSALGTASQLLERACLWDEASLVAEEKLFCGGALDQQVHSLGAYEGKQLVGVAVGSGKWIRLLAVCPRARGRGVGTRLLEACESQMAVHAQEIVTMAQPGNYLSPGIDERNLETIAWLGRRGYSKTGSACNLLISLRGNPRVSRASLEQRETELADLGYELARMAKGRKSNDIELISQCFSKGWAFEMSRASLGVPNGAHIAIDKSNNELAGFAAHDGNNRGLGWFGPTGTLKKHRGKGIAGALLIACLLDIKDAGHELAQVAWIGPRAFYEKVSGVSSERRFSILSKSLNSKHV